MRRLNGMNPCSIQHGEPVIKSSSKRPAPEGSKVLEKKIREQLDPISVLDVLMITDKWIGWSKNIGP